MFYPVSPRLTVFLLCFCVLNFSLRVNKSCNCSASCPAAFHLLLFYSIIFFAFRIIARAYSCTMYINPRLAALCALLFNSFTQLASMCQCVCVCARSLGHFTHQSRSSNGTGQAQDNPKAKASGRTSDSARAGALRATFAACRLIACDGPALAWPDDDDDDGSVARWKREDGDAN